jgi:DNA-binding response OmpR family regulator
MSDILLVEDDPGQAHLVTKALARAGYAINHVPDAAGCLERVRRQPPSLLLLDRGLPDCDGFDLLRTLRAEFPQVCVIMLTGADDAAVAVDAMRIGAADYVVKRPDLSHLTDLPLVLARNRERLQLLREHEALNQAVRASEERYRELFANASDAIFVCDNDGLLQQVNRAFLDIVGCTREDVQGRQLTTSWRLPARLVCKRSASAVHAANDNRRLRSTYSPRPVRRQCWRSQRARCTCMATCTASKAWGET